MLKDVASFREAVNAAMTVADLRRALLIHQVPTRVLIYVCMCINRRVDRSVYIHIKHKYVSVDASIDP